MPHIDPASSEAPFARLQRQILTQVADPGDRLPTVRHLAGDLGIGPGWGAGCGAAGVEDLIGGPAAQTAWQGWA